MSLRGQFANWLWQSASPAPLAPLPKGGCRGDAVTGGFFSRASCNPSVGAGFYPARPGFYPARLGLYRTS